MSVKNEATSPRWRWMCCRRCNNSAWDGFSSSLKVLLGGQSKTSLLFRIYFQAVCSVQIFSVKKKIKASPCYPGNTSNRDRQQKNFRQNIADKSDSTADRNAPFLHKYKHSTPSGSPQTQGHRHDCEGQKGLSMYASWTIATIFVKCTIKMHELYWITK